MEPFDQEKVLEAMRIAATPAGQQLLQHLQQAGGESMNQAMARAADGDFTPLKKLLSNMMNSTELQKIRKELGGSHGPDGR